MFKKTKFAVAGAVIAAAMASTSAYAATETAEATVNVLGPLEITVDNALDFGTIAPGSVDGTVEVGTTSDVATCLNVACLAGTAKRGEFHISSAIDGAVITIGVDNVVDLTNDDPLVVADPMTLTSMTLSDADGEITYDAAATEAVFVGGTLTVKKDQAPGTYTGSFDITAEYQ
jgi:Mat/Ecp fimbriae major subunit